MLMMERNKNKPVVLLVYIVGSSHRAYRLPFSAVYIGDNYASKIVKLVGNYSHCKHLNGVSYYEFHASYWYVNEDI
jgi:hypothetical protein